METLPGIRLKTASPTKYRGQATSGQRSGSTRRSEKSGSGRDAGEVRNTAKILTIYYLASVFSPTSRKAGSQDDSRNASP